MTIPSLSFDTFANVIDGKLMESTTTRRSLNPATLEENAEAPLSTVIDVNKAVQAAQKAAKLWAETSWDDRKAALLRFTQAFEEHRDKFAQMLNKEQGKSVRIPLKHSFVSHLKDARFSGPNTRSVGYCLAVPERLLPAHTRWRNHRGHPTGKDHRPLYTPWSRSWPYALELSCSSGMR